MALTQMKFYLMLMKPKIMLMSIFSSLVGMVLADRQFEMTSAIIANLGIAITVGAACAFNMYFERDTDLKMERTKKRPLPNGNLRPEHALLFCVAVGVLGLLILFNVNLTLGILGLLSLFFYVVLYTLLKTKTYFVVLIGMLPGAAPVLMGWVATGRGIDWAGLWLFFLIIIWQIPHTLVISHYLEKEYKQAGIKTLSSYLGVKRTHQLAVVSSLVLLLYSSFFIPFNDIHPIYLFFSISLGSCYLVLNILGYQDQLFLHWAYKVKNLSLVHLSALFVGFLLSR